MFVNSVALHRLIQNINWQGSVYAFSRYNENEYGEKNENLEEFAEIRGLFHNGSSPHVKVTTTDAGSIIEKTAPYIMATWIDAEKLHLDDQVEINGKIFKVTGVENIGQFNLIGEISLEVLL